MITKEEMDELNKKVEEGKMAERKLNEYNRVTEAIEKIEYSISKVMNRGCYQIEMMNAGGNSLLFNVEDKTPTTKLLIKRIMEDQKKILDAKLISIEI